jgi:hypothetical protein
MFWIAANLIYLLRWAWTYDLNRLEIVLSAFLCVVLKTRWHRLQPVAFSVPRLANRPILTASAIGLLSLALRALVLPVLPIPSPLITDEFSHLLLGDTLSSGHLANPPHPMWRHFETIHVIQHPTYSSMYLPAQGAVLALGKWIFGHPWWGVWLSNGLMCAALCWMLQQWLPPRWALFGGALAVLHLSVFSYWNDSYWGGAVPALGGALVLGAAAKIRRQPSFSNGMIFGAGAVVLLFSRPYEGAALCLAAVAVCRKQFLSRAALSSAILLLLGCASLSYYCYRVTGSAFTLPYQVNRQTYGWPMTLLWQTPPATHTTVKQLHDYYDWELSQHNRSFADSTVEKAQFLWGFFLGPCLTLPLLFLRYDRRIRPLLLMGCAVLAAVLAEQTGYPHYFSPATGALLALVVQGARHMRHTRLGAFFVPAIPLVLAATLSVRALSGPHYLTLARRLSWCCEVRESTARSDIQRRLESTPGQHLVIVHYGPNHEFDREWVYNAADIDSAKVVWARDLGPAENREIEAYFPNRKLWEIDVNQ